MEPRLYKLPYKLMDFFFDRARNLERIADLITDRQKEISDKQLEKNFDKFVGSDQMRAMLEDYRLFGEEAIVRGKK